MQIDRAEIAQHVDLSALAEGTEVRAYTLVHEGESRPHDLDTGETLALRWGRAVVRRVAALARAGTQFVRSHTDRTVVGELLGTFTKEVAGKLRAIVIGAFKPGAADGMDVCSVEADGVVADEHGTVTEVETVDRIALGSSAHGTEPGFPNAVLVGAVQCFVEEGVDLPVPSRDNPRMTVKLIKDWLGQNEGVLPSQLFSDEQIEAHPSMAAKLRDHERQNGELTRTIGRRSAKDAMQTKVVGWTSDAQFYADTAFDGWSEATNEPAKLDEWLKSKGEQFKGRTGKDVVAPKPQDGDGDGNVAGNDPGAGFHHGGQPAGGQPNEPPKGGGADVVQTAMQTLGILKKEAA